MSVHLVYIQDGAKKMRPVLNREEYIALRNGGEQRANVAAVRSGNSRILAGIVYTSCLWLS